MLFAGSELLRAEMVAAVEGAPPAAAPMEAIAAALDARGDGHRRASRLRPIQRQQVIGANRELQERELLKLASLSSALRDGLLQRGITEPDASLGAEAGMAVFRVAFERWLTDRRERELGAVMRDCMAVLSALTGATSPRRSATMSAGTTR